jgi:hypothetical protein
MGGRQDAAAVPCACSPGYQNEDALVNVAPARRRQPKTAVVVCVCRFDPINNHLLEFGDNVDSHAMARHGND